MARTGCTVSERSSINPANSDYGAIDEPVSNGLSKSWSKHKRWAWASLALAGLGLVGIGLVAWPYASQGTTTLMDSDGLSLAESPDTNHNQAQSTETANDQRPNILFIMADDLGWGDVSWHDPEMATPFIEHLATTGLVLNQSYVNMLCSPTRSALFTGYDPYHIGTQQGVFVGAEPTGVPLNFTFFTNELQKLNYTNYMVGKWHLGYCKKEYLPTYRGFDYFQGFLQGGEDYFTHKSVSNPISPEGGLTKPEDRINAYDFWTQDQVDYEHQGEYTTELFGAKANEYLAQHKQQNADHPFFMYLSYQSNHFPLQVPEKYLEFCHQKNKNRRTYCAMGKAMDDSIRLVIEQLKALHLYDNTLIIFQTDNGGDVRFGASNYPLRGNKVTVWEGGTRAVALVHSPRLLPGITGHRNDLFYVTDWYPTLLSLAGKPLDSYGDGINQWPMLRGAKSAKTRKYFVYNIDVDEGQAALRYGDYKLIVGNPSGVPQTGTAVVQSDGWYKPARYISYRPIPKAVNDALLFDVIKDPTEQDDLYESKPLIVQMMRAMLDKFQDGAAPNIHKPAVHAGNPKYFNNTLSYGFC